MPIRKQKPDAVERIQQYTDHATVMDAPMSWNLERLISLGVEELTAELAVSAGLNWHDVDNLVRRGCPLNLALEIAA